jgi:hypothetical protein
MRDPQSARTMIMVVVVSIGLTVAGAFSSRLLKAATKPQGDGEERDILKYMEDLTKEGREDREEAANAIRALHGRLVERLIELAKQHGQAARVPQEPDYRAWHEPKHLAILLLGDLRASQAVQVLLENLEYLNPAEYGGSYIDRGGQYPAVGALSKIGMPAVGPTIQKLSAVNPKSRGAELCRWILTEILGVKLGRARLQIAIEETHDQTAKANLKAALPYFRTPEEEAAEERAKAEEAKRGRE